MVITQLLVSALVLLSFVLVIAVPVILASPSEWENSKANVFRLVGIWSGLVIFTGFVSGGA